MRTVLGQMQAEGKLASLTEARKGKTESGSFVSNSRGSASAPVPAAAPASACEWWVGLGSADAAALA